MSASTPRTANTNFNMKHREIYACSDIEYEYPSSCKKPRISETFPHSGAQTVLNEARTRNFKTQLCRRFRLGICTHGSRCSYAHCIGELRGQEIGGDSRTSESKLCRMFSQGKQCSYGYTCRFLHIRPESINSRESSMVEIIPTEPVRHSESESDQLEFKSVFNESLDAEANQKTVLLRTKLCNKWGIKGDCPFGKICRFAHGQAESGKVDGYPTSECRVMETATAATTDASISVVPTGPLLKKEPCALNCKFKRNDLHKISRIYADWI